MKDEGGRLKPYVDKLLAACGNQDCHYPLVSKGEPPQEMPSSATLPPLVEPLSKRELEVLHLIAQGLSNQEISTRLFLTLSTVKGHNQRIFDKLQVQRRTEAVALARELGLL